MNFRVLGPVAVLIDGMVLNFPRRQQRLIVGILALDVGRTIPVDRLIDLLWGERPPAQARATMHSRISELRTILATAQKSKVEPIALIIRRDNGYALDAPSDWVDANEFKSLVERARECQNDLDARDLLNDAAQLWRGPALGGWLPRESHEALCQGLESARISALEDLFDTELRLGRHHHVVDRIVDTCLNNISRERLTALSMLALHRVTRTPEALLAYERYRRWAGDELGIDPSQQLENIYLSILRDDERPATAPADGRCDPSPWPTSGGQPTIATDVTFQVQAPNTLPSDIPDFVGRRAEQTNILELITRPRTGVPVAAVTGPAGIGKTAFSVHVAHQLRTHFSDGQLYADLHGADWEHPPSSAQVLARFLRAFGVQSGIPDGIDERIDMYRRLLSDRKVLILLDNAADADQVIPLIPGSSSCAVLINSRARIGPSLGADVIELGVLDNSHAVELLSRIAGQARVQSQPVDATTLVRMCGGLPLAIRVVAAKLAAKPHWSVELMIARLSSERLRLDQFAHGHLSVRSSIGFSYASLTSAAKRLFRRLGDIGYPQVNVWTAAALLDTDLANAEELLEQLHDAQLVEIAGAEANGYARYRLHDLVRLFAAERAAFEESQEELDVGRRRAFGAWLCALEEVEERAAGGHYLSIRSEAPKWSIEPAFMARLALDPLSWFDSERLAVVHMIRKAFNGGSSELCWRLAVASSPLFQMRGYHDDWRIALDIAHTAVIQASDDRGHAALLLRMGTLSGDHLAYDTARLQFQAAKDLFSRMGEDYGQAVATAQLAVLDRYTGNNADAMSGFAEALPGLRKAGDQLGEAFILRNVGQAYLERDQLPEAEQHFSQALNLAQIGSSRRAEAQICLWQGMLYQQQKRYQEAERLFAFVLEVTRSVGDNGGQAQALHSLGKCYIAQGRLLSARSVLSQALPLISQPRPIRIETALRQELARLADELNEQAL